MKSGVVSGLGRIVDGRAVAGALRVSADRQDHQRNDRWHRDPGCRPAHPGQCAGPLQLNTAIRLLRADGGHALQNECGDEQRIRHREVAEQTGQQVSRKTTEKHLGGRATSAAEEVDHRRGHAAEEQAADQDANTPAEDRPALQSQRQANRGLGERARGAGTRAIGEQPRTEVPCCFEPQSESAQDHAGANE
jgi:hypothetical protein